MIKGLLRRRGILRAGLIAAVLLCVGGRGAAAEAPANFFSRVQVRGSTSGFTPGRTIHDGNGAFFPTFDLVDQAFDVLDGKQVRNLVRVFETSGEVDANFQWNNAYGAPRYLVVQPDGKLLVAVSVGGGETNTVLRVSATGLRDPSFSAPFFQRTIRFLTLQPDGKVLVSTDSALQANFPNAITTAGQAVHRLNSNGSIDFGFNVAVANSTIFAPPHLDSSGRILLAGAFTSINEVSRVGVARLLSNGALDNTFANPSNGQTPTGLGAIGRGIQIQSDGGVIIGGRFFYSGKGTFQDPVMVARIKPDGSFDTSFSQPLRSQLGIISPRYVRHVVPADDGGFYAVADRLMKFSASGIQDPLFPSTPFNKETYWISRSPNSGTLFVADLVDEQAKGFIGAFHPAGSAVGTLMLGQWAKSIVPRSAIRMQNGNILLAGNFSRVQSASSNGVAVLSSTGEVLPVPSGLVEFDVSPLSPHSDVAVGRDGSFYLRLTDDGDPSTGQGYATKISRHLADGTKDPSWTPAQSVVGNLIALPSGGLIEWLPALPGSQALVNQANWIKRFNRDGTLDSQFVPDLSDLVSATRSPDGPITALRVGRILGVVPQVDDALLLVSVVPTGEVRLHRLLPSGARDPHFQQISLGQGASSTAQGVVVDTNGAASVVTITTYVSKVFGDFLITRAGHIYLTGDFQIVGFPRSIIRLLPDNTVDSSFVGAGLGYFGFYPLAPKGFSLGEDEYGRVYVAGRFNSVNGASRPGIARFNTDGSFDTSWSPAVQILGDEAAGAKLVFSGGYLHIFGTVAAAGGTLSEGYRKVSIEPEKPVVLVDPASASFTLNSNAALTMVIGGATSYQWFKNGQPIAGATQPTLAFNKVSSFDSGEYVLESSNSQGVVRSGGTRVSVVGREPQFWDANPAGWPLRLIHDKLGGLYLLWNTTEETPEDIFNGIQFGRLVRLNESTGTVDPSFTWDSRLGRPTYLAQQSDGKLLVAVEDHFAGSGAAIVRVYRNGAIDSTYATPRLNFTPRFLLMQPNGKLIVFASEGRSLAPMTGALILPEPSVLRLNADGSVDGSFIQSTVSTLLATPTSDSSGRTYLGTLGILSVNGQTRYSIARLGVDGSLDPVWGAAPLTPPPTNFAATRGFRFYDDNSVVLVGRFLSEARGTFTDPVYATKLSASGQVDNSFVAPKKSELGLPNARSYGRSIIEMPNDRSLILADRPILLNRDGSIAAMWPLAAHIPERDGYALSRSIATGNIFVVPQPIAEGPGAFGYLPSGIPLDSFSYPALGVSSVPRSAAVLADGSIVAAGDFDRYAKSTVPGVVRITKGGSLLPLDLPAPQPLHPNSRVLKWPDGSFCVIVADRGDEFTLTGSRFQAFRFDTAGQRDPSWSLDGDGSWNFLPMQDGGLLAWKSQPPPNELAESGAKTFLRRYRPDGQQDSAFSPAIDSLYKIVSSGSSTSRIEMGTIHVVQVGANGKIYALATSTDGTVGLFRLNATGGLDGTFNRTVLRTADIVVDGFTISGVPTKSFNSSASWKCEVGEEGVYVATSGTPGPALASLFRIRNTGGHDSSFPVVTFSHESGPLPYPAKITGFMRDPDSKRLYLAGRFTHVNGQPTDGLVRVSSTGGVDHVWAPPFGISDTTLRGTTFAISGATLAVFGTISSQDGTINGGFRTTLVAPEVQGSATVLRRVIGSSVTLQPTIVANGSVVYQWLRNGAEIPGATSAQLEIAGLLSSAGSYSLRVTDAWGTATHSIAQVVFLRDYTHWKEEMFEGSSQGDPTISGPTSDIDGDGLSNLFEFALGTDPLEPNALEFSLTENGEFWTFTYVRPADRGGIAYAVESSDDMISWSTVGVENVFAEAEAETCRVTVPKSAAVKFFRIAVRLSP